LSESRKTRTLIVEDEPRYRSFLEDVLRDMDCTPVGAKDAEEALRAIAVEPPELLLLDLNLPLMDGLTFLERFRKTQPETPVVILTGFGDLAAAKSAIRLRVSDFLTKPCDLGQIEVAIDRARRRGRKERVEEHAARGEAASKAADVRPLAEMERAAIFDALRQSAGNRSEAARRLGISRRSLYNKIGEYEQDGHEVP
jgi:DNA-binding NtrC family response regulator